MNVIKMAKKKEKDTLRKRPHQKLMEIMFLMANVSTERYVCLYFIYSFSLVKEGKKSK